MNSPVEQLRVGDLVAFLESHSALDDEWSDLVGLPCFHFAEFVKKTEPSNAARTIGQGDDRGAPGVRRLLAESGLPAIWEEVYRATGAEDVNANARWSYLNALYADLDVRLGDGTKTARDAGALANLVEAIINIELDLMEAAYNYVPRWNLWWNQYMAIVDSILTPRDLRELSSRVGFASYTECMSSITPPDRLEEIYREGGGQVDNGVAGNPNLPTAFVDEAVLDNPDLIFHPNVTPSRAGSALLALLEEEGVEEILYYVRNFDNFRDDSWSMYANLPSRNPNMNYLYERVIEWGESNDIQEWLEELELVFHDRGQLW